MGGDVTPRSPFVRRSDVNLARCGADCSAEMFSFFFFFLDKVPAEELIGSHGTLGVALLSLTVDFSEEALKSIKL